MDGEGSGGGGEAGAGRTSQLGSLLEATGSSDKCSDCVKLRSAPLDNEYKVRIVTNEQAMVTDAIPDVGKTYVKLEEDEAGSGCEGFGCNASTSVDDKVETKRGIWYSPSPTPSKRRRDIDSRLDRILDLMEKRSRRDSEEIEEIAQMLDMVIEDGAGKGSVVYSYATQLFKRKEIRDMFSTFKKQDGRLEWLERTWDPVRWEIRRMLHMVVEDGAEKGSVVYSYATQLFEKKENRDMYSTLETQDGRLEWIERTWNPVRWEIRRMMRMVLEDGAKVGSDEYFYASQLCMKKEYRDVFTTLKTPTARLEWIKRTWEEQKKH